jgi:hypothetical protein
MSSNAIPNTGTSLSSGTFFSRFSKFGPFISSLESTVVGTSMTLQLEVEQFVRLQLTCAIHYQPPVLLPVGSTEESASQQK